MAFIPRIIEKFLDVVNLQRHNDNNADIKTELDKHDAHEANTNNPHNVTAAQVAAAPISHVGAGGAAHAAVVAAGASGFMTGADKTKLDGVAAGAEVNQNTFSKIAVTGQADVDADTKTDTLTLTGGTGITVSTDPASDTVTITATGTATPGAHASSHITGGADVIPNVVSGGNSGLMSGADKAAHDQVIIDVAAHEDEFVLHESLAASETGKGHVELATASETTTGIDDTRAVHPAGLKVELDKKANKAQEAWIAPTLVNSWVNFGGSNASAGYMKDEFGFVHIRGMVKSGALGTNIFILPAGYRPAANLNYGVACNNGTSTIFGYASVDAVGGVSAQAGANTWFSLDNIPPFRAE